MQKEKDIFSVSLLCTMIHSQWNITPVDAVHDIFQRHRRGEVVYGWHVDIILALALFQDAECLSFQDYESRIDALKVASGRPTIAPNKYGQPSWEATPDHGWWWVRRLQYPSLNESIHHP